MRSNASIADDTTKKTSRSGGAVPFPKPNRAMLFDSAGLACYIAWSFVFWNGSVLFGDLRHEAPVGEAQIVQAALTALAALVLVLLARRTAPLRRRTVLLAVFAAVSSLAIVVAALAGFGRAPMGWMLIAFALSGLGSTLRLGWEERMSVQGVERTAVCAGTAYLLGFLLFALISLLPALSVLAVSVLLPFGAFGLLEIAREHARELLAEVVRNHDGGVVITAPHALLGLLRIREDPAQVVVLLEFVDRLLAGVEFAREFGLHTRILVGDCDLDALGATVGIPVRLDVVPGVQGRNDAHTDGDDHRHWIVQQAEHIALEDLPCFSHACLIL